MKKKDLISLREKEIAELKAVVLKKKAELVLVKAKIGVGQEKNVKKTKNMRKEIAQILTIIKEKEIIERSIKK